MSMPPGGHYPQSFFWHRHYHHMSRRGLFSSRLLWFGLGAGFYAWYSHAKETHQSYWAHRAVHGDEWRSWSGNRWSYPRERIEQAGQMVEAPQHQAHPQMQQQTQWGHGWGQCPKYQPQPQPQPQSAAIAPSVHAASPSPGPAADDKTPLHPTVQPVSSAPATQQPQQQAHDWHADRIREAGKVASDSMSDMSEQALDSLISSIQGIKARIAESRKERDGRERRQSNDKEEPENQRLV